MHARLELLAFAIKSVLDDDSDISVLYDIVDRTEDDLLLFLRGVDAVMDKNEAVSQEEREARVARLFVHSQTLSPTMKQVMESARACGYFLSEEVQKAL